MHKDGRAGELRQEFEGFADANLTGGEDYDASADGLDIRQNVCAQENCFVEVASEDADAIQHGDAFFWIEATGGFIQNQQFRVMYDGHSEAEFLPHSGGVCFDSAVAFLPGAAEIEDFVTAAGGFGGWHAGEACGHLHGFDAGQSVDVAVIFGHVADAAADLGGVGPEW